MTFPIKLSQNARHNLRCLFGNRALPKILAALDQLATTPPAGGTTWRHLGVGDYQILYRPIPAPTPENGGNDRAGTAYLIAAIHRDVDVTRRRCDRPDEKRAQDQPSPGHALSCKFVARKWPGGDPLSSPLSFSGRDSAEQLVCAG